MEPGAAAGFDERGRTARRPVRRRRRRYNREGSMPRLAFFQRFAVAALLVASAAGARAAEIALACSGLGKEYDLCREGAEAWAKGSGHTVKLVSMPNSATERLSLFQQLLAAG